MQAERLVANLRKPVTTAQAADGWSERARDFFARYYEGLIARLADEAPFGEDEEHYTLVIRGLDGYGVVDGSLFEAACSISNDIRDRLLSTP